MTKVYSHKDLRMIRFLAAVLAVTSFFAKAQDLEPRAYSNAPVGLNFLIAGYGYTGGGARPPTLPLTNCGRAGRGWLFHGACLCPFTNGAAIRQVRRGAALCLGLGKRHGNGPIPRSGNSRLCRSPGAFFIQLLRCTGVFHPGLFQLPAGHHCRC